MPSFTEMANVTASTKRIPAIASGKIGVRVTNIASLKCMPIDPLVTGDRQPDFESESILDAHTQLFVTYCEVTNDIQNGDEFIVGSTSYTVKTVENWQWRRNQYYLQVILIKYRK